METFVLVVSVSLAAGQETLRLRLEIHTPMARFALERAAQAAVERLETPDCRKVLADFRDASGRTIQERLDLRGETPRRFLARRITFREGRDSRCTNAGILAYTSIEGREVFICPTQFWQVYRTNPSYVEALLIHEIMHTLGLGENPPSSLEINERVMKRCWSR
jgi:hypothetical protein